MTYESGVDKSEKDRRHKYSAAWSRAVGCAHSLVFDLMQYRGPTSLLIVASLNPKVACHTESSTGRAACEDRATGQG